MNVDIVFSFDSIEPSIVMIRNTGVKLYIHLGAEVTSNLGCPLRAVARCGGRAARKRTKNGKLLTIYSWKEEYHNSGEWRQNKCRR